MDNGGGRRRRHRSWLSESRSRHGVLLQPVGQEDRRLLLTERPPHARSPRESKRRVVRHRRDHAAMAVRSRGGDPSGVRHPLDRRRDPRAVRCRSNRQRRRRRHRHSHGQRAARIRHRADRARAKAPSSSSAAFTPRCFRTKFASTARRMRWSRGDGDHVWRLVLSDCAQGTPKSQYRRRPDRGRGVLVRALGPAAGRSLHVGLGPDGARLSEALLVLLGLAHRRPEAAPAAGRPRSCAKSSRCGARDSASSLLADDNFYPVTLADLAAAERRERQDTARVAHGAPAGAVRADGAARTSCPTTWCSTRRSPWKPPRIRSFSRRCGARASVARSSASSR